MGEARGIPATPVTSRAANGSPRLRAARPAALGRAQGPGR